MSKIIVKNDEGYVTGEIPLPSDLTLLEPWGNKKACASEEIMTLTMEIKKLAEFQIQPQNVQE